MAHVAGMVNHDQAVWLFNYCTTAFHTFMKQNKEKLWQVNGLLVVSAIFVAVIIWIGVYDQRYRHHPFTHYIFFGANIMFLTVISTVVSNSAGISSTVIPSSLSEFKTTGANLIAECSPDQHSIMVITWALLVQIIIVNTRAMIAVHDREGPSIGLPIEVISQAVWTMYLGLNYMQKDIKDKMFLLPIHRQFTFSVIFACFLEVTGFLLNLAKLVFKFYAVTKAKQSFAFAHNPCFVSAYMKTLPEPLELIVDAQAPPLLVMGEKKRHIEKQHHGYVFKDGNGLITIDNIWQFLDGNNNSMLLPAPTPQRLKDLCLSFSLFKLLRCRFARYELASQSTLNFLWTLLLKDDEPEDKIFGVIADELSFLQDYYNSSLTISYSMHWLPLVGIAISLLTIMYCISIAVWIIIICIVGGLHQMSCIVRCMDGNHEDFITVKFGSMILGLVLLSLILLFIIASEVRDIVSYICSNWAKVFHTCDLFLNSECCLLIHKLYIRLLPCNCKLINSRWDERISQCSVLPLRPRTTMLGLVRRMLHLSDHKTKLNTDLKISIIKALINSRVDDGIHLSIGKTSLLHLGQEGQTFHWAYSSNSVSEIILTWQIATSILEVRYPGSSSSSIVATNLSRYCAYLVSCCPALLPDNDDEWSKSLYEAVKKDVENALGQSCYALARNYLSRSASTPGYQELVDLLHTNSEHPVVKDGVKLGKQLVDTIDGEEAAWKLLADFWTEMILYVAPSDNLEGHKKAIALGGELITVLWALLNHAGNVSRLAIGAATTGAAATGASGVADS